MASALTCLLFEFKLRDDIQDREIGRRFLLKRYQRTFDRTRRWLGDRHFPTDQLGKEFVRLRWLEEMTQSAARLADATGLMAALEELARPTATGLAMVLAYTAEITGCPENRELLWRLGRDLGTAIYMLDNLMDYGNDVKLGRFNPLSHWGQAHSGGRARIQDVTASIRDDLDYTLKQVFVTCSEVAGNLSTRAFSGTIERIIGHGIPRTLFAHYKLAMEGFFDEPGWKRLLRYSRSLKNSYGGRDEVVPGFVEIEVAASRSPVVEQG